MYSFHFFLIVKQLMKIVYYWRFRRGFLNHQITDGEFDFSESSKSNHTIKDIPLKQQYLFFSGIVSLLDKYPRKLIAFCKANNIGKYELTKDIGYIPYAFQEIVDHLNKEQYVVQKEEIRNAIMYLRNRGLSPTMKRVSKLMGTRFHINTEKEKQRREIKENL